MAITFSSENNFKLKKKKLLKVWLKEIAKDNSKKIDELNYIFCNDEYLLKINIQYLNHDFFTDIITFDTSDSKKKICGDIFISTDRVKENAQIYEKGFENELYRVLVHGLLHLIGYNDETDEQEMEMRSVEDKSLLKLEKLQENFDK